MNIICKTIPHNEHRYPTVGDWWWEGDVLHIRVSKMSDWRYMFLVVFHELAEVAMCKFLGVTQQEVDAFDTNFEEHREDGNTDEPGDEPDAPYHVPHCIASGLERVMAGVIGVVWKDYDNEVNSL